MESFIKILIIVYLSYESYEDIKRKSVSIKSIILFSVIGIAINICSANLSLWNMILGVTVGLGVALIGKLMKDAIGMGDGAVLSSIGVLIGGKSCLLVFLMSITISAIVAIILVTLKRVKWKQELPFIPYILCAYVMVIL